MKAKDIPLHDFMDPDGYPSNFDILLWGKKDQSYDIERPHRHQYNEVLVFYEGGGAHDIDFVTYPAQSHAVHFVAANSVHMVLRDKKISSGCSLLFTKDYFSDFNPLTELPFTNGVPVLQLTDEAFAETVFLVERIKDEYFSKHDGYRQIIQNYMNVLMLHWQRIYKAANPKAQTRARLSGTTDSFLKLVEQSYNRQHSLAYYAEQLCITPNYLTERCRKETGKTPSQLLNETIATEAKKLLFHTGQSIKEIAFALGYSDPAHFSRFFKKQTGYTPVAYREGIAK